MERITEPVEGQNDGQETAATHGGLQVPGCAGPAWAVKLCSLCAQLYLASAILTRLLSLASTDLSNIWDCTPLNPNP